MVQQVAEMCDGESMEPVMVGRVPIALLHHQQKPGEIIETFHFLPQVGGVEDVYNGWVCRIWMLTG